MTTDNSTYRQLFHSLIQHKESEVVEFKKAENNFDFDDLGKYLSALSNETNLRGLPFAWLVFGYDEKQHEIVGTSYKDGEGALNKLKHDLTNNMSDGQTFREMIHPANAQITWVWKDKDGEIVDYEHYTIPYILAVDKIFAKIRNKTMRELPGGTLFPDTMKQYEDYSIREALHNCIAHQDYTLGGRITLVENEGFLYYSNRGSFIPGSVEKVLSDKGPQKDYRNTCLSHGMVHFNMIDTVGRGIPKLFKEQRRRFFPMPEYEIDDNAKTVSVTIYGIASDDAYTDLLKSDSTLSLMECLWLDAVRTHRPITKEAARHLKDKKLIEGKAPRYNIALSVAKKVQQIGQYTKETGLNKKALVKLVLQLAANAGNIGFKRADVFEIIEQSLPVSMTRKQKLDHVSNMLRAMQANGFLVKTDNGKAWLITTKGIQELNA